MVIESEPVAIPEGTEATASSQTNEQQTDPYPGDGSSYFSTGLSVCCDASGPPGTILTV